MTHNVLMRLWLFNRRKPTEKRYRPQYGEAITGPRPLSLTSPSARQEALARACQSR